MLNKTNAHGISVGIFFELHPGIQSSRPRVLGVQKCRRLQNYSVFFDTCNLLLDPSWGSQEKGRRASGSKIAEDRKLYVFIVTCNLLHWTHFCGSQEKGDSPCLGKQNCRRSQTLCFYCYFRSSAIDVTFRFAEPRQSSSDPYIKNPSVSWDRGGLQGIFAEDALHRVPPSNKYIIAFEGA